MDKNVIKKHIRGFEILFIFVLFLLVSSLYWLGFFERFELILIDSRYQTFPAPVDPSIAIVAIDNSSLKEISQWPWPRTLHGGLVDQLREGGAQVIGFDMDFSTQRSFEEDMEFSRKIQNAGNVVLGVFSETRMVGDMKIQSSNFPIEILSKVSTGLGTLAFPADLDGGVRRGFFDDELNGESFFGFGTEIFRVYKGFSKNDIKWLNPRTLQMGKFIFPSDPYHIFYLHYAGPAGTFPTYSYSDVLKGRIDPAVFREKIVLVGASSVELQDLWNTPFQGLMPGVEIQANMVNSLLTGSSLYRINSFWSILIMLGVTLLWVSFSSFYVWKYDRWKSPLFSFLTPFFILFSLSIIVSLRLFSHHHMILDTSPILTQLFGMFMVSAIMLMIKSGHEVDEKSLSLTTLQSVGSLSHENRSLDDSVNFILSMLQETIKVDCSVAEILSEKEKGRVITKGNLLHDIKGMGPYCKSWVERVFEEKKSFCVNGRIPFGSEKGKRKTPQVSSLFSPILSHGKTFGVLHVHNQGKQKFREDDLKMLFTIASQMALVIEYEQLLGKMKELFLNTIEAFSSALDFRDNDTAGHSQRVTAYSLEIGRALGLRETELEIVTQGALLHDIGKIGIPDAILNKPGRLTEEEYQIMKEHAEYGFRMLKNIKALREASLIVFHHQERFDGKGYPQGLRGEEIVIGARIFSVADTYDAMISDRCYRKGVPDEEARKEIKRYSGTQFDPKVVEAFLNIPKERFKAIRDEIHTWVQTSSGHTLLFR